MYETLKNETRSFLFQTLAGIMNTWNLGECQIPRYRFLDMKRLLKKKVVIYGAGVIGQNYYAQMSMYSDCEIAAWVDSRPEQYSFSYAEVKTPKVLGRLEFDCIVIAVQMERVADEISAGLAEGGIQKEKIVWMPPESVF